MKPIQLNNHQIEALNNGATMLWMPCSYSHEDNDRYPHYIRDKEMTWHSYKDIVDLIDEHSPFEIGQEYYVQEDQDCINCGNSDFELPYGIENGDIIECKSCQEENYYEDMLIKFKVTDIQVKQMQSITEDDFLQLSGCHKIIKFFKGNFYEELSSNPYGFLVTIKRIED